MLQEAVAFGAIRLKFFRLKLKVDYLLQVAFTVSIFNAASETDQAKSRT